MKGDWWWNEVKENVKEKKDAYVTFINSGIDEEKDISRVRYKIAKKVAVKVIVIAKNMTYNRLYQKLEAKEGEKEVFKIARAREGRTRDLGGLRCIKGEDDTMLTKDC